MKTLKDFTRFQKITGIFICLIGMACLLFLIPSVQNFLVSFAEKLVTRKLQYELWVYKFVEITLDCIVFCIIALIALKHCRGVSDLIRAPVNTTLFPRYFSAVIIAVFASSFLSAAFLGKGIPRIPGAMGQMFWDMQTFLLQGKDTLNPYFRENYVTNYLPLAHVIFYPFYKFSTFVYPDYVAQSNPWFVPDMTFATGFIWTGSMCLVLFYALNIMRKRYNLNVSILLVFLISLPCMAAIAAGNEILLSAGFVVLFLCWYDSENKTKRLIAAAALACAATLKIFPVFYGFLYFRKKQYKEIIISACVTLLLVIIPFFFLKHGLANIPKAIDLLTSFSSNYGIYNLASLLFIREHTPSYLEIPPCVISIALSFFAKDQWKKLVLITFAVLFFSGVSHAYCALYLFPVVLLFFATLKERTALFNLIAFSTLVIALLYSSAAPIAVFVLWAAVIIQLIYSGLSKKQTA